MRPSLPDISQHVARRLRITRMFFKISLEETADFLNIPVWLLYYKENGLVHFSYKELLDIERLYKMPWIIFFQDFMDLESTVDALPLGHSGPIQLDESALVLNTIMQYLALADADFSDSDFASVGVDFKFANTVQMSRDVSGGARRWA